MLKSVTMRRRTLSLLLALCMLFGLIPMMSPEADAVYHMNNAAAASEEVLNSTNKLFAATPGGAMLRVVDGKLYVWGYNTGYGTGLAYYDSDGDGVKEATDGSTAILSPTLHDFAFDGEIVKIMTSCNSGVTVLTDKGKLYSWGAIYWEYIFRRYTGSRGSQTAAFANVGRTPIEWDLSQVTGTVVDIYASPLALAIKDSNGKWYLTDAGYTTASMVENHDATNYLTFKPITEAFIDKLQPSYTYDSATSTGTVTNGAEQQGGGQRTTIEKIIPTYGGGSCFIIVKRYSGARTIYSMGTNNHGQNFLPDQVNDSGVLTTYGGSSIPVDILNTANYPSATVHVQNLAFIASNPDIDSLQTEGHNSSFIDASGSVWIEGDGHNWLPDGVRHWVPQKIYDAGLIGAKARRVYTSSNVCVILAEDNSLYALGRNANQFISTDTELDANVTTPTQVFTQLSEEQTIAGVYVTELGVMVVTAAGETYFAGDNSKGTSGNGTDQSPEPGQVDQSVQPGLPPIEPTTANRMFFEIETADGTRYSYDPTRDSDGNGLSMKITSSGGNVTYSKNDASVADFVKINAGSICKLNVYFEDFAKLNGFTVPIRFNPKYVQIVNGENTPYSSTGVITPGAVGSNVGITKGFTNDTWKGGVLIGDNVTEGGYPKICNGEGWISVSGYSTDRSAGIDGTVKMFSVNFTPVATMPSYEYELFDIATDASDNIISTDQSGFGYDKVAPDAVWSVPKVEENGDPGLFKFKYDDYLTPKFQTTLTYMSDMTANVKTADGTTIAKKNFEYVYGEAGPGVPANKTFNGAWIAYVNKSAVYTVALDITPDNTSFPQVSWEWEVVAQPHGEEPFENHEIITVLNGSTTGDLKFQVSSEYPDGMNIVVKFTAKTLKAQADGNPKSTECYVIFRDFNPPNEIVIVEKSNYTDDTAVYTSITGSSDTVFTVDFPGMTQGFDQTALVWTLLDNNGNAIASGDQSAAATLGSPTAANKGYLLDGYVPPSVSINLQHTTKGSEKLTLRVESAYDATKCDEMYIKIHQQVTSLAFSQETLFMTTDSSRDIRSFLNIGPENEYYEADLEWTYQPVNADGPYYLYTNGTSTITAGNAPSVNDSGAIVYDQISVRDRISGTVVDVPLKVAVISVNSPIGAESIVVHNILGSKGDYADVSGLKAGDTVIFTKSYDTPTPTAAQANADRTNFDAVITAGINNATMKRFENLTAEQIGAAGTYKFPLPDFLKSEGGDIGFILLRKANASDSVQTVYDKVPVAYGNEPSKVYGYVRLEGKASNSEQNAGIEIQLVGLSNPTPVKTNKEGYFVFEEYIIPGNYTMIINKQNYLRRVITADAAAGYNGITVPTDAEEFAISTYDSPIYLYPGDLNGDGGINATDINNYVRNWYGQYDYLNIADFAKYDFYDGAQQIIDLNDLNYVVSRNGWVKENYANWQVPVVK